MEKRELKVGDMVRIKSREELERLQNRSATGFVITEEMKSYGGAVGTVEKATSWYYYLSVDGCSNLWLPKWVEPMLEKTNRVYMYGVPGRGDEVIALLRQLGGSNVHGMSGENEGLYFIAPSGNIGFVDAYRESADVIREQYKMVVLPPMEPEEEKTDEAEEKKLFVLVHDNRCMRRLVNSPEEAGRYAKWIQQDKPGTMVEVYEAKLCAKIKDELPI